ncbi:MAG: FIST N-terminal domain-containing protein [Myxococcota bacterium]|nr:FIST N-terminal domain-containing protein [Myxococcota bacterium]
MRWSSVLSTQPDPAVAAAVVTEAVRDQLEGAHADLMLVFACGHEIAAWTVFIEHLRQQFPEAVLLGCSAGGVVGGGREVEGEVSLSVTAASLPDVAVVGFHYDEDSSASVEEDAHWWHKHLGVEADHQPSFLLIPDPYSCDSTHLMKGLDRAFPGQVKLGGLASGANGPGENVLILNDQILHAGAVGVALYGDIEVDAVVAQGCRPVGEPMVVTRAEGNLLIELSGGRALDQLQRVFAGLGEDDQALFRGLPMVGLGMEKGRGQYRQGDFLIRHLMGMDRTSGVLAVGAMLEEGQVVQFHVRDAESSRHDLEELLVQHARSRPVDLTEGAIMFSCLGRGHAFFGEPDHDCSMTARYLGGVAIGGFFCAGEIGPVHGQSWLHGYTSAIGIFRPRGWS